MKKHHEVENVCIQDGILSLIVDGQSIQRDLKTVSPVLAAATQEAQNRFEVSPSGYGIRWPVLDEDIAIDGLLGISHQPGVSRKTA